MAKTNKVKLTQNNKKSSRKGDKFFTGGGKPQPKPKKTSRKK